MGEPNSQVCFARMMFEALITDIAAGRSSTLKSSLGRDLVTLNSRLTFEGISFCTITLPTISKAVLRSFKTGSFTCPSGFSHMRCTSLPKLFSGLMREIYADDGTFLEEPSYASITEVLQLSGLGYKLEVGYSDSTIQSTLDSFRAVELSIAQYTENSWDDDQVIELARTMVEDIFFDFNPKEILPRHGPGSVATGERGVEKWKFARKYDALHQCYPYYEYFVVNPDNILDSLSWYKALEPLDSGTAKVVLVPKDSRGPRIISMEPLEYQYIQQGLWREIKSLLESHAFTRQHVNFTSQKINQDLALQGSIDGSWATLDMKDASDRVSLALVRSIFKDCPYLLRHLECCRSPCTELPDTGCVDLHKFSPMGSALCFPIESLVHFVLTVSILMVEFDLTRWQAVKSVYVYGDDLIVDSRYAHAVVLHFPSYGLMFNEEKCYLHGPFRESCGTDAYKGHQISPIRWREPWSERLTATSIQAFCDMASRFYARSYYRAADLIWRKVEEHIGPLPTVPLTMNPSYPARVHRNGSKVHTPYKVRWNLNHQIYEHYCPLIQLRKNEREMLGWERLLKFLSTGSGAATEFSSYSVTKKRWTRVFDEGVRDFNPKLRKKRVLRG